MYSLLSFVSSSQSTSSIIPQCVCRIFYFCSMALLCDPSPPFFRISKRRKNQNKENPAASLIPLAMSVRTYYEPGWYAETTNFRCSNGYLPLLAMFDKERQQRVTDMVKEMIQIIATRPAQEKAFYNGIWEIYKDDTKQDWVEPHRRAIKQTHTIYLCPAGGSADGGLFQGVWAFTFAWETTTDDASVKTVLVGTPTNMGENWVKPMFQFKKNVQFAASQPRKIPDTTPLRQTSKNNVMDDPSYTPMFSYHRDFAQNGMYLKRRLL